MIWIENYMEPHHRQQVINYNDIYIVDTQSEQHCSTEMEKKNQIHLIGEVN